MKLFFTILTVILLVAAYVEPASARNRSTSGGSSGKTRNYASGFIQKHCKTASCFKKHPDGKYAIPLSKNKKA